MGLAQTVLRATPALARRAPGQRWALPAYLPNYCLLARNTPLWLALDSWVGLSRLTGLARPRSFSLVSPSEGPGFECDPRAFPHAQAAAQRHARQETTSAIGQRKAGPALCNSGGKCSSAISLDRLMRPKLIGAADRFRCVAAGVRMPVEHGQEARTAAADNLEHLQDRLDGAKSDDFLGPDKQGCC